MVQYEIMKYLESSGPDRLGVWKLLIFQYKIMKLKSSGPDRLGVWKLIFQYRIMKLKSSGPNRLGAWKLIFQYKIMKLKSMNPDQLEWLKIILHSKIMMLPDSSVLDRWTVVTVVVGMFATVDEVKIVRLEIPVYKGQGSIQNGCFCFKSSFFH